MKRQLLIVVSAFSVSAATPSLAADTSANNANGRFTMAPADNGGFVRLDTQTGVMALCKKANSGWSCNDMPDTSRKLTDEIASLKTENNALKGEIQAMEETFGLNDPAAPGKQSQNGGAPAPVPPKFKLPTEQEVDKALDYVERMLKKFRDRFRSLEDSKKKQKQEPETTPL